MRTRKQKNLELRDKNWKKMQIVQSSKNFSVFPFELIVYQSYNINRPMFGPVRPKLAKNLL